MQQQDPRADRSRGAVYQAEDAISSVMSRPHRAVRVEGQVVTLPAQVVLGDLATVQRFVDSVLADAGTRQRYPQAGAVRVEPKRGYRSATYAGGVIHIPLADPRGRWALARTVVLHEVAHHLAGRPGHGPQFRAALLHLYAVHLGPGAAALLEHLFAPLEELPPSGEAAGADSGGDQVRRVAALLAKARSTQSGEESEAYLARAAIVAQRHSVDLAVAALQSPGERATPSHRMLSIGRPRAPLNALIVGLLLEVARAWSVRVDIGPGSTYVLVYGMPADLDQVESVFATASALMVARAEQHVRSGAWRGTTYRPSPSQVPRPVTARVARNAFCLGFTERLGARVREAASRARAEHRCAGAPGGPAGSEEPGPTVALALRERAVAVDDYHRRTTRARRSWRGSASAAAGAADSRRAGARAAEEFGRASLPGGRRAVGR